MKIINISLEKSIFVHFFLKKNRLSHFLVSPSKTKSFVCKPRPPPFLSLNDLFFLIFARVRLLLLVFSPGILNPLTTPEKLTSRIQMPPGDPFINKASASIGMEGTNEPGDFGEGISEKITRLLF